MYVANLFHSFNYSLGTMILLLPRAIHHNLLVLSFNFQMALGELYQLNSNMFQIMTVTVNFRPLVKSAYQKIIFLSNNQNICCGYSNEPSQ